MGFYDYNKAIGSISIKAPNGEKVHVEMDRKVAEAIGLFLQDSAPPANLFRQAMSEIGGLFSQVAQRGDGMAIMTVCPTANLESKDPGGGSVPSRKLLAPAV